jgi:hypothetical protein
LSNPCVTFDINGLDRHHRRVRGRPIFTLNGG